MKKRSKCSPLAFGFISKMIEDMTKRPDPIRDETVLKYCRGIKTPCTVFDDFAFHKSKSKMVLDKQYYSEDIRKAYFNGEPLNFTPELLMAMLKHLHQFKETPKNKCDKNNVYDVNDIPSLCIDFESTSENPAVNDKKFVIITTTPRSAGDFSKMYREYKSRSPHHETLTPDTKYHVGMRQLDDNRKPITEWVDVTHLFNTKTPNRNGRVYEDFDVSAILVNSKCVYNAEFMKNLLNEMAGLAAVPPEMMKDEMGSLIYNSFGWHIDCSPKKEDSVEGAQQTISITLPKGMIYEFLGKETLDPEKQIVKYDVRGKIIEVIPHINKVTMKNAEGLFVAWPDEDEKLIYVGISRLKEGDKFDFGIGITNAMLSAAKNKVRVPIKYRKHFEKFLTRCRCYYEQLQSSEWGIALYEGIEMVRKENTDV